MTVRRARVDESAAVAELAAETFPLACPPEIDPADVAALVAAELTAARFAARLGDPDQDVLVATDGATLLGYVLLVAGTPTNPEVVAALGSWPAVELSKCYVRSGHHGTGRAAELVAAAADRAVGRGAAGLWLGVSSVNARAQRFYAKHGFTPVGHKDFQVGNRLFRDVVLERTLV